MKKIHEPYDLFKGWLRANHITYAILGDFLGVTPATVSAKINGTSDFFVTEVNAIRTEWGLNSNIFLQ